MSSNTSLLLLLFTVSTRGDQEEGWMATKTIYLYENSNKND
jgi:hypothetical protein